MSSIATPTNPQVPALSEVHRRVCRISSTGIIDGSAVVLRWYPATVAVDGSGELAYSSGPALYEKAGAQGPEYRLGAFHSIWRRDGDGAWRVVFDDGIRPQPATPEEAAAFSKGQRERCPQG